MARWRWRLEQRGGKPDLYSPWFDTIEEAREDAIRAGHARRHDNPTIGFIPHLFLSFEDDAARS